MFIYFGSISFFRIAGRYIHNIINFKNSLFAATARSVHGWKARRHGAKNRLFHSSFVPNWGPLELSNSAKNAVAVKSGLIQTNRYLGPDLCSKAFPCFFSPPYGWRRKRQIDLLGLKATSAMTAATMLLFSSFFARTHCPAVFAIHCELLYAKTQV